MTDRYPRTDESPSDGTGGLIDAAPAVHRHRPWSTALLAAYVLIAVLAIGIIGVALLAFVQDNQRHDDMFDGLGAGLAVYAGVAALAVGGTAAALVKVTRSGRRRADDGDPRALHRVSVRCTAAGVVAVMVSGLMFDANGQGRLTWSLSVLVLSALWTLAHGMVLRATSGSPKVSEHP